MKGTPERPSLEGCELVAWEEMPEHKEPASSEQDKPMLNKTILYHIPYYSPIASEISIPITDIVLLDPNLSPTEDTTQEVTPTELQTQDPTQPEIVTDMERHDSQDAEATQNLEELQLDQTMTEAPSAESETQDFEMATGLERDNLQSHDVNRNLEALIVDQTTTETILTESQIQDFAQPEMCTGLERDSSQGAEATQNLEELKEDPSRTSGPYIAPSVESTSSSSSDDGSTARTADSSSSEEDKREIESLAPSTEEAEKPHPTVVPPGDVFRQVPRPQLPIRMSDQDAVGSMRYDHFKDTKGDWRNEPSIPLLEEMIRPALDMLGFGFDCFTINFLATGAHNKVYIVTATACDGRKEYVLRVSMPLDPYYKVECEVATMELVRHFTRIPVPVIYAYDSSSDNKLNLEWMLMEKVSGEPLTKRWLDLDEASQTRIVQQVADWENDLSKITSSQIGGIYLHWTTSDLQFYIGRCVEASFYRGRHILYDFHRGPFQNLNEFYDSVIHNQMLNYEDDVMLLLEGLADRKIPSELMPKLETLHRNCKGILQTNVHPDDRRQGAAGPPLNPELQLALETLRHTLPWLNPVEDGEKMHTRLSHGDISYQNIMMDTNNNVTALLDWEHINLWPNIMLQKNPKILKEQDLTEQSMDTEQPMDTQPDEVLLDDPEIGVWTQNDFQKLRVIQERLRPVYRRRLEEIASPLLEYLDEEDDPFKLALREWCTQEGPYPSDLTTWINEQCDSESEGSESEWTDATDSESLTEEWQSKIAQGEPTTEDIVDLDLRIETHQQEDELIDISDPDSEFVTENDYVGAVPIIDDSIPPSLQTETLQQEEERASAATNATNEVNSKKITDLSEALRAIRDIIDRDLPTQTHQQEREGTSAVTDATHEILSKETRDITHTLRAIRNIIDRALPSEIYQQEDESASATRDATPEVLSKESKYLSDTLRTIPRPQYPIRVCEEGPHLMRPEMRRHWLKVTVSLWESEKNEWRTDPNIDLIAEVVAPTLDRLDVDCSTTRVSKLSCGGFNQVFTVEARDRGSLALKEFVFRVPLPIDPYYKTECEVATMEIVRNFTSIRGESLMDKWHDLSNETLADLTIQMASWQTELCSIESTKIGGIYMRWVAEQLEFFVGPSVDLAFSRDHALYYNVPRGPFESVNDFYSARLQVLEHELMDPVYLLLSKGNLAPDKGHHPDQQKILDSLIPLKEEILSSQLSEDDRENRRESGPQRRWTDQSLSAVRALRNALWVINPTDPSHAMAIMLTYNDLAERNIMVDAKGNVTSLLDWEYLDLQSLLFMKMKPHPEFVGSDEEEQNEVDDDIEMMSNSDEETEDELSERLKLERYVTVTAHLRMVYVKRLLQLESPLLELLEQEETSNTILRDRILYAIENDQEMIDWVNDQVEAAGGKGSTVRGDGHGLSG